MIGGILINGVRHCEALCGASIEHMRKDAKCCSEACKKAKARGATETLDAVDRFYREASKIRRRQRRDKGGTGVRS